jgi:arsenate reductase
MSPICTEAELPSFDFTSNESDETLGASIDVSLLRAQNMRLYHNPRCSKSRQALALLQERGIEVDVHRYLEEGILNEDLDLLAEMDGIVRSKEAGKAIMAELTSPEAVKNLLRTQPKLLERPVLVHGGKAVIGRPPEDILALLE